MARGRRNDRTGPRPPSTPDSAGDPASSDAATSGVPASYETIDFEEIAGSGTGTVTSVTADPSDRRADSLRDEVMSQHEDSTAAVPDAAIPVEPERYQAPAAPPPRRGGFVPGLIGGLLGGAAMVLGGGWYATEHGPIKAKLDRLEAAAGEAQAGVKNLVGKVEQVTTDLGALGGDLGSAKTALEGKLEQVTAGLSTLGGDLSGLKTALDGTNASLGTVTQRVATEEAATGELKTNVEQASNSFRAASQEVIGRLEAVNAKLVEVEQAQPADVVDKKTVADIAAKQASVDAATQSVAAALVRVEQMVTQSLEAGNQQSAALRTVVDATQKRLDEVNAQQRELLALKDQVAKQEEADQRQLAALADTGNKVTGVRTDLEQRLTEVTGRLTALDAARERGVGLSIAAHGLEEALTSGEPFQPTIAIVSELAQGDPAITGVVDTLKPLAPIGVPTFAALAQQLGTIEQTLTPVAQPPADDWLARTRENLEGLVNLHAADAEAVPGQNAVQGATQALLNQDLAGAVSALQPLADQGNAAAQAWIAGARERLDATAAVGTLLEQVKTILAQQG